MDENTEQNQDGTPSLEEVGCSVLLALIDKWDERINHLKCNSSGQHAIPKARIQSEIKGMRLCKKHLKAILS